MVTCGKYEISKRNREKEEQIRAIVKSFKFYSHVEYLKEFLKFTLGISIKINMLLIIYNLVKIISY